MRRLVPVATFVAALAISPSTILQAQAPIGLAYSTYYGRFGQDEATDVAVDADGYVYVVGMIETAGATGFDAFVTKLTPDGSQIVYETFLRGSGFDIATGIVVDAAGAAYVVGHTTSNDFPMAAPLQSSLAGSTDVFVARLDASGALEFSSYYGGSSFENGSGIALGPSGDLFITGSTGSTDLPGVNGLQQTYGGGFDDAFVVRIAPGQAEVVYATYLGGSGSDSAFRLAADASGHAYIAGQTSSSDFPVAGALQPAFGGGFNDGFVTKLSPDGDQSVFSTYLGGGDRDLAAAIAVDAEGAVHVGGSTSSFNFPVFNAYQPFLGGGFSDAFLATFQPDGSALRFSTFFGGQGGESAIKLILDSQGNHYLSGDTDSFDLPLVNAVQQQVNGTDGYVMQLSSDGQTLLLSTPLGGSGLDVIASLALTPTNEVWLAGRTDSDDFPLVDPIQAWRAGSVDTFVARLGVPPPPNQLPIADAGDDVDATANGCVAQVTLDGTRSIDPDGDPLTFEWSGEFGTATGAAPTVQLTPGTHTVTLRIRDEHGGTAQDTVDITVHPDPPPQIVGVHATPNVLSPPDHRMVPVEIAVDLSGGCPAATTCEIVSVRSSEPVDGLGRGDLAPDWEVTGPLTLLLRAEHGPRSPGRRYAIVVECLHASGDRSRTVVFVAVPRR